MIRITRTTLAGCSLALVLTAGCSAQDRDAQPTTPCECGWARLVARAASRRR